MASVFRFKVWDETMGKYVEAPGAATARYIFRVARGQIIAGPYEVDQRLISPEGQVLQDIDSIGVEPTPHSDGPTLIEPVSD